MAVNSTRQHFDKLDSLYSGLIGEIVRHPVCVDRLSVWDWELWANAVEPRDIQYVGKSRARDEIPAIREHILHHDLQAMMDGMERGGWRDAHAHGSAIHLRHENLCELVDIIATNKAYTRMDKIDDQTALIIDEYRDYALSIAYGHMRSLRRAHDLSAFGWCYDQLGEYLVQASLVALLKASRNYNANENHEFKTHVYSHVRAEIWRDVEGMRSTTRDHIRHRLGNYMMEKIHGFIWHYLSEHGYYPSDDLIVRHFRLTPDEEVVYRDSLLVANNMIVVGGMLAQRGLSGERLAPDAHPSVHFVGVADVLQEGLKGLTEEERGVLLDRIGIEKKDGIESYTADKIFSIKKKALRKLRTFLEERGIFNYEDYF